MTSKHSSGESVTDEPLRLAASPSGGSRWWLPRLETVLLLLAFAWTALAKYQVVRVHADDPAAEFLAVMWPDLVFFSAAALGLALLHLLPWKRAAARMAVVVASVILLWSICNAAWTIDTSVQLQPDVLWLLLHHPQNFWPVVEDHLRAQPKYTIPVFLTALLGGAWILWRLIRPAPLKGPPLRRAIIPACLLLAAVSGVVFAPAAHSVVTGSTLGFSSHWESIVTLSGARGGDEEQHGEGRIVARSGERELVPPEVSSELPNVVIVFLESVPHAVTSLAHEDRETTPYLAQLGEEGVEFVSTRVPMTQTSKALWAALTGMTPDVQRDFLEAVPVDVPYESLATILRGRGYKSAFFEMCTGEFECAPGLFANLGYDWAWFRENLEDPESHLGYMSGDDFRMLGPMFEWVDSTPEPFLLTMITSVAHDPYELPEWYEHDPAADRYQRYLEAVRFSDRFLQELCRRLEERKLTERTLLCVIGDHGEGFRPESKSGRWVPFEELIRVPWVMRWPQRIEPGRRVHWPCSQLDVTPTILSLLGYGIADAAFDGSDALEPQPSDRRLFFSSWFLRGPMGYVEGDRKVIYWPYLDRVFEYDLSRDPGEQDPRILEGRAKREVLDAMRGWKQEARQKTTAAELRERLLFDHWRTFGSGRRGWTEYVDTRERRRQASE